MALTVLRNGLEVDFNAHRAVGRFTYDSLSDLPDRGDFALWVQHHGADVGDDWYVDEVTLEVGLVSTVRIVARQPGYDWTWADLAPIERLGRYDLNATWQFTIGSIVYGYWHIFSNWDNEGNWGPGGSDPLDDALQTWEIEFVADTNYHHWLHHVNGAWPAALVPPAGTGAGIYKCTYMDVDLEPWYDFVSGTKTLYYRHFAVFQQAPSLDATQLTWRGSAWT